MWKTSGFWKAWVCTHHCIPNDIHMSPISSICLLASTAAPELLPPRPASSEHRTMAGPVTSLQRPPICSKVNLELPAMRGAACRFFCRNGEMVRMRVKFEISRSSIYEISWSFREVTTWGRDFSLPTVRQLDDVWWHHVEFSKNSTSYFLTAFWMGLQDQQALILTIYWCHVALMLAVPLIWGFLVVGAHEEFIMWCTASLFPLRGWPLKKHGMSETRNHVTGGREKKKHFEISPETSKWGVLQIERIPKSSPWKIILKYTKIIVIHERLDDGWGTMTKRKPPNNGEWWLPSGKRLHWT